VLSLNNERPSQPTQTSKSKVRPPSQGAGELGGGPKGDVRLLLRTSFIISPDGRRFLMIKQGGGSDQTAVLARLVVVFNWFEELKRLVPTTR